MYNNTGNILYVDLSEKKWWREAVKKEELQRYLGSRGISARILWDRVRPGTDPLGPENVLIFGAGLLTGTAAPSSGRTTVTCLSPATGIYAKTNGGGYWGGELRYAGFSHVVILGRSEKPVYLWIDDDRIELRDASRFWGMDLRDTNAAIKREQGDEDIKVAAIGPGGENQILFASIMFSINCAAGRCGSGAVMGSKNLKAVAVRGSGSITPAQPEQYHEIALKAHKELLADSTAPGRYLYGTSGDLDGINELGVLPSYNFSRSSFDGIGRLSGVALAEEGFLKRRPACFGCVMACHRYCTVEKGAFAGAAAGGPEYETIGSFGSGCALTDPAAVIKANELCDIYGLDTISTGGVIQWAMECFEKGVITREDLDGEELRWGNGQAVCKWIKKIAFREGFGDILARGTKRAAEHVGGGSEKWAVQDRGLEQSRVDTRNAKAYALAFAVNPRGPDHLFTETLAEFGGSPEARAVIKKITGDEKYAVPHITDKRAEIVRWHEDCYAVTDCLGFCAFTSTASYGISPEIMAETFSAFTGFEMSEEEIMEAGQRIVTLERCFNARLARSRKDDRLPWRVMNDPSSTSGAVNSQEELDEMLDQYYELHGWNVKTGLPTREALERLYLDDVANDQEALGLFG